MKGRGLAIGTGIVLALAGVVLLVFSVINRDAGMLWMPWLHIVGWALILVAVAFWSYSPEEASRAKRL